MLSGRALRSLSQVTGCSGQTDNLKHARRLPKRQVTSAAYDYFAKDQRPIILFDGVCNLCNGGVNFVLDWDKEGVVRLAALQSPAGRQLLVRCGRQPQDISSIVFVEKDRCSIKSEAVLRIADRLKTPPLPFLASLALPVPTFVRDAVYDQVANNRYNLFGKSDSCRLSDDRFSKRFIGEELPAEVI